MSDLNQIITVSIDRNTTTPTAVGFGTPLLLGYFPTSIFPERVRTYTSLAGLTTDGFTANDPIYKMAQDLLAQNPSPPSFKVGRREGAPQQVITITPDAPVVGEVHTVTVVGYGDAAFASRTATTDTATVTIASEADQEDIVDALITAFGTPDGDFTPTKSGTGAAAKLVITADNTTMDGMLFGVTVSDVMGVVDSTPDPATGIATDLAAVNLYDPDWYCLLLDSNSHAEIDAAAAWVETNTKIFVTQTQDAEVASTTGASDTTSVAAGLKAANYDRTMLFFHRNNFDFVSAAMAGRALPEDAGSITWAYKQLASAASQNLTTTEMTNLEAKNVNFLSTLAGVAITRYGIASGGEYLDIMRGSDWLAARIQERVYTLLVNNDKLPFTDAGIQAVRGEILAQLQQGVGREFIAATPEPTCTVPLASAVSAADKGTRTLNDVKFRATLAGAVHKVAIEGELNL